MDAYLGEYQGNTKAKMADDVARIVVEFETIFEGYCNNCNCFAKKKFTLKYVVNLLLYFIDLLIIRNEQYLVWIIKLLFILI